MPQLARSLVRLAQARSAPVPHSVSVVAQRSAQAPALHTSPAAQLIPQAPQLALSVARVTQRSLHTFCPAGQLVWHTPAAQICPAAQAVPHMPQLARSLWRSRHEPEQSVCPVAQEVAHMPEEHT